MISASHPEIWQDHVNQILMTKEDQERLTELCKDPRNEEVLCKYAAFLTADIASARRVKQEPEESQIVGKVIQRELPINAYHVRHPWTPSQGEKTADDENYIGMPIPVAFEKNIGLKKTVIPSTVNFVHKKGVACKCLQGQCNCRSGKGYTSKSSEKFKRVASKDLKASKLDKRKELYAKYTNVEPEVYVRVKTEIDKASKKKNCCKEKYFEPKKYVLEQITPGRQIRTGTSRTKHLISIDESTERLAHLKPITPSRDSMVTRVRTTTVLEPSHKIPVLEEMVELMELCMKNQDSSAKKAPSVSTKDFSVQANLQPQQPPSPEQPALVIPQKLVSRSEHKVKEPKKNTRIIKELASTKKVIKVIERQYELDKDSFEVSELLQHVPSRVMSLSSPVEKKLKRVDVSDDPRNFDTVLYSPENVGIVDEHLVEFERRKVYERIIEEQTS